MAVVVGGGGCERRVLSGGGYGQWEAVTGRQPTRGCERFGGGALATTYRNPIQTECFPWSDTTGGRCRCCNVRGVPFASRAGGVASSEKIDC